MSITLIDVFILKQTLKFIKQIGFKLVEKFYKNTYYLSYYQYNII